ncbi:MAG: hypothetical protein JHC87_06130, partial [Thermoleophilaceae bacterium]|nr:hypothetical protein [Thermoleophilaceae bacterium]
RYNVDGSLDSSFGGDGTVLTPIGASDDNARAVVVQSDGKIVVAGNASNGSDDDFALARYNTNGSLDSSFDGDGILLAPIGASADVAYAVAQLPGGRLVVGGISWVGAGFDFSVARFNSDGSFDNSFDGDGKVITAVGTTHDFASSLAVQTDGKLILVGRAVFGKNDFAIVRYNPDGSLDASFDGDGIQTTSIGAFSDDARAVAIQADGKIVLAGSSSDGVNEHSALARFNVDGSLDSGFDGDGKLTTDVGPADALFRGVAVQTNGKIVAVGPRYSGGFFAFGLSRFNADGSLDSSFDGDGMLITEVGPDTDFADAVAVQQDGKIVVAGSSWNGLNFEFALARYVGDPPPPATAPAVLPIATITAPSRRRTPSRSLTAFAGTAGPTGQVAKVEVALRKQSRSQLKRGNCLWLKDAKAKLVKVQTANGRCGTRRFLTATGSDNWSFKLRNQLSSGRYRLYVRVTLKTGEVLSTYTKSQGNLRVFSVS